MSWDNGASTGGGDWQAGAQDWKASGSGTNGSTDQDARSGDFDGDQVTVGFNGGQDGGSGGGGGACRNCGQEGHFARDCTEARKMGACFNCGEEGHSKIDCPQPRTFKGECRSCGQAGHPAADCPNGTIFCKNCREEGHEAHECKNPKVLDRTKIPEKTEREAYAMLKAASDERDITDFKEAVEILSKACPDLTYSRLEKELRKRGFSIYIIALKKDHGDTLTNVNLQGEIEKKYTIGYFFSEKPQRPNMKERWPESPEDNLERLGDAGVPMDRGVEKCSNCEQLGHSSRKCPEEKMVNDSRAVVKCALCDQEGHRVRDCTQERRKPGAPRTCKVCESEEHMAKDCPNREKRACRNCGSEDHMAKECDQPRNPATMQCRNCDQMGHGSRECTAPKDWSRVTCSNCDQKGHTKVRCKQPPKEEEGAASGVKFGFSADDSAPVGGGDDWKAGSNTGISAHKDWENSKPEVAVGGGNAW